MNFEVFWSWWEQMLFRVLYESWMLFPLIPLSCCWPDLCIFLVHTCWSVLWWIPKGDTFGISSVLSLSRSLLSSTLSCKFWLSQSPWVLSSVSPSPRAFQAPPSFPFFYFPAASWKLTKTVRRDYFRACLVCFLSLRDTVFCFLMSGILKTIVPWTLYHLFLLFQAEG